MLRKFFVVAALLTGFLILTDCNNSYSDGKRLYERHCQSCHMEDGAGLRGLIPPLAQSDYLKDNFEKLPCIILIGLDEEIEVNGKTYNRPMAGIGDLETFEVVLIINYINHAWGNDAKYTDFREVEANLQNCQ